MEFEPAGAVDAALMLFWDRGFEQTSMQDLEARTGLSRSSLYNTFQSKADLFGRVLERYVGLFDERVLYELTASSDGVASIHRFIDVLAGSLVVPDVVWGCLMINSLTEFGGHDPEVVRHGREYMAQLRRAIATALGRAASRGEIDANSLETRGDLLLGLVLGINVLGRSGVDRTASAALIHAIHAEVDSWRTPTPAEAVVAPG